MPSAPILIAAATTHDNIGSTNPGVTPSFTPPANALLLVYTVSHVFSGPHTTDAVTATFGLSTGFTETIDAGNAATDRRTAASLWVGITSASPGAGTISVTLDSGGGSDSIYVYSVDTDFDTTTPVLQSISALFTAAATVHSLELASALTAGNIQMGWFSLRF